MFVVLHQIFTKWIQTSKMTTYKIACLGFLIFSWLLTACGAVEPALIQVEETQADYTDKKILWIDSYHQGYEWSNGIEVGLRRILEDSGVEFQVVRMDTKRNTRDGFRAKAALMAKTEIEAFQPAEFQKVFLKLQAEKLDLIFSPSLLKIAEAYGRQESQP